MPTEWTNSSPPSLSQVSVAKIERTKIMDDLGKNGATVVTLVLPDSIAKTLLDATTNTQTTPLAEVSRSIARPVGLALKLAESEAGLTFP